MQSKISDFQDKKSFDNLKKKNILILVEQSSDLDPRTSKSLRCISENQIFQQFTDFLLDSRAEGIEWSKKINGMVDKY